MRKSAYKSLSKVAIKWQLHCAGHVAMWNGNTKRCSALGVYTQVGVGKEALGQGGAVPAGDLSEERTVVPLTAKGR
jgi:hypothetical protein